MLLCSGAADTNISDTNIESTGITSGITTGEVAAATVTPVVFVTLTTAIIVLMVVIYLKKARSVHCSVDSQKVLDFYSYRSLKAPTLYVERLYIGLYHFRMLQGSVFKYCIHAQMHHNSLWYSNVSSKFLKDCFFLKIKSTFQALLDKVCIVIGY